MSQLSVFDQSLENMPPQEARQLLIELLREAAKLEHSLLNSYLYAACSIRSTPQEFDEPTGHPNRRRAVQFERARGWKQRILMVAQEEMRHLHNVQCLLRGLGASPCFELPDTDPSTGNWRFQDWKARFGSSDVPTKQGVEVPLAPFSLANCRRFVLYESTDALQNDNPFGPETTALFEQLYDLEADLRLEGMLLPVNEDTARQAIKTPLDTLYTTLTPLAEPQLLSHAVAESASNSRNEPEAVHFQSIADLYLKAIEPLYNEAFAQKWVVNTNRDLVNELLNPDFAAEGFLPIGPIYRDQNFQKQASLLDKHPLTNYKTVAEIITEIVEEGEGAANFEQRADFLLKKVAELGGGRAYWMAWMADKQNPNLPTPGWLKETENLRQSHLYRFAMILTELKQEEALASQAGRHFEPARTPLPVGENGPLYRLTNELPTQFNACYLVMTMWLSRMYEIKDWLLDKPQREAIEMLASWPLMSMAIRPFLELASLLPVSPTHLFRTDTGNLPTEPAWARKLAQLVQDTPRSQAINDKMDQLAGDILTSVADWAQGQLDAVNTATWPDHEKKLVLARLSTLTRLNEFKKQFIYRTHGGYSNRMPDEGFIRQHPDSKRFEEDPSGLKALFANGFALRIRFAGQGLVQLATDPDPPKDEAGCTGTQMLHTADGDRRFNRALVWQNTDPDTVIERGPAELLPPLGVNAAEVSLLVTAPAGTAGYVPLQIIQSMGAVQTQGIQQDLTVSGMAELLTVDANTLLGGSRRLQLDLADKDGQKPYLFGDNHLVWKDGEPIDPFILTLRLDDPTTNDAPQLVMSREVYNQNLPMTGFTPLQRAMSMRGPVGFGFDLSNIPDWATGHLSPVHQQLLPGGPDLPMRYLAQRAGVLQALLTDALKDGPPTSQEAVDAVISYAERLLLIALPRNTTVFWLKVLCHYGHTISGDMAIGSGFDELMDALHNRCQLPLQLQQLTDRSAPNARWLTRYTLGMMDTDALSNVVYGELYIPLMPCNSREPVSFSESWTFPAGLEPVLLPLVARFGRVFWTNKAQVTDNTRTWVAPGGIQLTETLLTQTDTGYTYQLTGLTGVLTAEGSIGLALLDNGRLRLSWTVTFTYSSAQGAVTIGQVVGQTRPLMQAAIQQFLGPTEETG